MGPSPPKVNGNKQISKHKRGFSGRHLFQREQVRKKQKAQRAIMPRHYCPLRLQLADL
jgi:hypothetical protein